MNIKRLMNKVGILVFGMVTLGLLLGLASHAYAQVSFSLAGNFAVGTNPSINWPTPIRHRRALIEMAAALLIVSGASVQTNMPEGGTHSSTRTHPAGLVSLLVDLPVLQHTPRNPRHISKHSKEGFNDEND